MKFPRKPEVMSPAGYWPQLRAAVEAGADAVYFGLKHFTARAKVGFELSELPEVMRTLHRRGVKGYITFNTLVFNHELEEAAQTRVAFISRLGEVMLPGPGTVLQEGDVVHVIAVERDLERISAAFARGMQGSRSHGKGSH